MQTALTNFENEIKRIDKVAGWLTMPTALSTDMIPATLAVRCGAVVLLSGYLETFIKECMCAFITQVNNLGQPLSKLPDRMKHTHFRVGAKVLGWQLRQDKMAGSMARCEELAGRIASVNSTSGRGYILAWEAFADTEANPGPGVIAKVLGSVGVEHVWRRLRAASPGGLVDLQTFLTSFIAMRNECAHSGNIAAPPSASELIEYGANLAGLGGAIVAVLTDRITELSAL